MLPQMECACNAIRALRIKHTPFETNSGFSLEEPLDIMSSVWLLIPNSQEATTRLQPLHEIHVR
jgi:hypothetical protein